MTTIKTNLQHVFGYLKGTYWNPKPPFNAQQSSNACTLMEYDGLSLHPVICRRMALLKDETINLHSNRSTKIPSSAFPTTTTFSFSPLECISWAWFVVQAITVTQTRSSRSRVPSLYGITQSGKWDHGMPGCYSPSSVTTDT